MKLNSNQFNFYLIQMSNLLSSTNNNTRNQIQNSSTPFKQGWILKKGGSGLLSKWRTKFMILSSHNNHPILQLFDERDPSKSPKHELHVSQIRIDSNPSVNVLKKGASPFIVLSKTRKV